MFIFYPDLSRKCGLSFDHIFYPIFLLVGYPCWPRYFCKKERILPEVEVYENAVFSVFTLNPPTPFHFNINKKYSYTVVCTVCLHKKVKHKGAL